MNRAMNRATRIVIGTRRWLGPDWCHVDADPAPLIDSAGKGHPVDVVCDARAIPLPTGCAEQVYSQECLEHFPWGEYRNVLAEWARLVGAGGELCVEVPDFLAACRQVLDTDTSECDRAIQQIIFGGQVNRFDYHFVGLTPRMLTDDFEQAGLTVLKVTRGWECGYLRVEGRR